MMDASFMMRVGFGDPTFPAPKKHEEVEHNRLTFAALKAAHEEALRGFFTANRQVIDEIAERLTRDSEIDSSAARRLGRISASCHVYRRCKATVWAPRRIDRVLNHARAESRHCMLIFIRVLY